MMLLVKYKQIQKTRTKKDGGERKSKLISKMDWNGYKTMYCSQHS